jgi:MoaA/NifB/PqqE/SkfB family radical SAM enzyme
MKLLSNLITPFLDWIQVEVTSCCNAECVYCPHTVYREFWQESHMPVEAFEKLLPAFRRTSLVYLQGWGEPLLHPRFFEMARIARKCGSEVGTTTNGMLVGEKAAEQMVSEGLSVVGFSLAGTDESQDAIRRGTRLTNVLLAMERLGRAKNRLGSSLPEVHVAYMWLRSQFEAVKRLPALLDGTGVSQVVVSSLDFVPYPDLATEAIQARDEAEEAFLGAMMSEVAEDGRKRGLDIYYRLVTRHRPPGDCTENVTRALFVSSRGLVSPCVFRNVPLGENRGPGGPDLIAPQSIIFGDIGDQSLSGIWRQNDYRAFRWYHAKGMGANWCGTCTKLFCSPSWRARHSTG